MCSTPSLLSNIDGLVYQNELSMAPQNSTSTYNVSTVTNDTATPPRNPVSYVTTRNTPGVIGAQERYKDPRDRREAQIKRY